MTEHQPDAADPGDEYPDNLAAEEVPDHLIDPGEFAEDDGPDEEN